ncbi:MAG TPA: hypothetical protein VNT75_26260 [Symbiobacteriaceae bacterium]|nr:hypothetical protein [Symbiobacteriaceae bacterium]
MAPKAGNGGAQGGANRRLPLGGITIQRRNYKDPYLIIPFDRYSGKATAKGSEIIARVGEAQGEGRKPAELFLAESEKQPGDIIGVPTSEQSDDNLKITWVEGGKVATVQVDKLLAYKKIVIPADSRMFISLYVDEDSTFGTVIGMKVNSADFEPIRRKKGDDDSESGGGEKKAEEQPKK